jgi:3-methyladenine DNA glycosylase AlkD
MIENHLKPSTLAEIKLALQAYHTVDSQRAAMFFKTGKGQYAEKDEFIGVKVPDIRMVAKRFAATTLPILDMLLASPINQERLLALFIVIKQYQQADGPTKEVLYQFYLKNLDRINNWNLVDASAHLIVGAHLWDKDKALLFEWAQLSNLWRRRMAMVATWYFIRKDDVGWTYQLAAILLNDVEELVAKAVGWMLREAGKRDERLLCQFLDRHAARIRRTALRYAIERLPKDLQAYYLQTSFFISCFPPVAKA